MLQLLVTKNAKIVIYLNWMKPFQLSMKKPWIPCLNVLNRMMANT